MRTESETMSKKCYVKLVDESKLNQKKFQKYFDTYTQNELVLFGQWCSSIVKVGILQNSIRSIIKILALLKSNNKKKPHWVLKQHCWGKKYEHYINQINNIHIICHVKVTNYSTIHCTFFGESFSVLSV